MKFFLATDMVKYYSLNSIFQFSNFILHLFSVRIRALPSSDVSRTSMHLDRCTAEQKWMKKLNTRHKGSILWDTIIVWVFFTFYWAVEALLFSVTIFFRNILAMEWLIWYHSYDTSPFLSTKILRCPESTLIFLIAE